MGKARLLYLAAECGASGEDVGVALAMVVVAHSEHLLLGAAHVDGGGENLPIPTLWSYSTLDCYFGEHAVGGLHIADEVQPMHAARLCKPGVTCDNSVRTVPRLGDTQGCGRGVAILVKILELWVRLLAHAGLDKMRMKESASAVVLSSRPMGSGFLGTHDTFGR